jgi:hypothetical protein
VRPQLLDGVGRLLMRGVHRRGELPDVRGEIPHFVLIGVRPAHAADVQERHHRPRQLDRHKPPGVYGTQVPTSTRLCRRSTGPTRVSGAQPRQGSRTARFRSPAKSSPLPPPRRPGGRCNGIHGAGQEATRGRHHLGPGTLSHAPAARRRLPGDRLRGPARLCPGRPQTTGAPKPQVSVLRRGSTP